MHLCISYQHMKRKISLFPLIFFLGLTQGIAPLAHAEVKPSNPISPSKYTIYVGLQTEYESINPKGNHSNLSFISPTANLGTFTVNNKSAGVGLGLQVGYHTPLRNSHWLSGYSFGAVGSWSALSSVIKGQWEYTLHSPSNYYHYNYEVAHGLIGASLLVDIYTQGAFSAFAGPGIGVDWLQSKHFEKNPIGSADVVTFSFLGDRRANVYYEGQLGLRYSYKTWSFSLAYVYRDLGKVSTGEGRTDAGSVAPALKDKVRTQNAQLVVRYYF